MRLTTMLVLTTAAFAAFAPAASAAITSPPDWGQPGPDPSTTSNHAYGGGCISTAQAPHKAWGQNRGTVASGGLYCPRSMQSVSVLACTDIYAPNAVWSVGGLIDGSSWRPLSCTAAPDATNVVRLNAVDVNDGRGLPDDASCSGRATRPSAPRSSPSTRAASATRSTRSPTPSRVRSAYAKTCPGGGRRTAAPSDQHPSARAATGRPGQTPWTGWSLVLERAQDVQPGRAPGGEDRGEQADDDRGKHEDDDRAPRARRRGCRRAARSKSAARPMPTGIPSAAPSSAVITASWRIIRRVWRRVMPTARSIPSSRVRSNTVSTSVFTIPNRLTMIESASRM